METFLRCRCHLRLAEFLAPHLGHAALGLGLRRGSSAEEKGGVVHRGKTGRFHWEPGKNADFCGEKWEISLESYGFLGRNRGDFSEHVAGRNPAVTNQGLKAGQLDPSRPYGYGSIPINTIFRGMNIHKSQLF
jgi:hypothetical protein